MPLILPQIVYNGITLSFSEPPIQRPGQEERHLVGKDVFTLSGIRQRSVERIDYVYSMQMEYVAIGADLSAWAAFIDFAMQGGTFDFYPDVTELAVYETMELVDTDWNPKWNFLGFSKFTLKMRRQPDSAVLIPDLGFSG